MIPAFARARLKKINAKRKDNHKRKKASQAQCKNIHIGQCTPAPPHFTFLNMPLHVTVETQQNDANSICYTNKLMTHILYCQQDWLAIAISCNYSALHCRITSSCSTNLHNSFLSSPFSSLHVPKLIRSQPQKTWSMRSNAATA